MIKLTAPRAWSSVLGKIQADCAVFFHQGQVHSVTLVGDAIAIQIIAEAIRTIGHTRVKRLPHRCRALLDDLLKRCQGRVRTKARKNILKALLAQPAGGQNRPQVAFENVGEARIARKNAKHLVVQHPLTVDADRRHDNALVIHLGRRW